MDACHGAGKWLGFWPRLRVCRLVLHGSTSLALKLLDLTCHAHANLSQICDFGLSRILTESDVQSSSAAGHAFWMAPELLRALPYDEKVDVYAYGKPPFSFGLSSLTTLSTASPQCSPPHPALPRNAPTCSLPLEWRGYRYPVLHSSDALGLFPDPRF